ncbi:MAG: hypothetical protein KAY13_01180 [Zoogloea sp.]|nr:hypothetical protein [Zoogloea sp.]
MPDVSLSLKINIADGPSWSIAQKFPVEAYDVIDLIIPPGTIDRVVELQPAAAARVNLVVIQSSLYGPEILFKTSSGADDSTAVALLGPQLYGNSVATLFTQPPNSLKLSNSNPATDPTKAARIQILVGRDATP